MTNDRAAFRNEVHFGQPAHFGMKGNVRHSGSLTDLLQKVLQIYRKNHFGMKAEPSFSNEGNDLHFERHSDLF